MMQDVISLLHDFNGSTTTTSLWQELLNYPWRPKDLPAGYVLRSHGKIVGFVATTFSTRKIQGKEHLICNFSSWTLHGEHRGVDALRLLMHVKNAHPEACFINSTPAPRTVSFFEKMNFQVLDKRIVIIRRPKFFLQRAKGPVRIFHTPEELRANLDANQLRLHDDHRSLGLGELLIQSPQGNCYCVYTSHDRNALIRFARVHHVSHPQVLAATVGHFQRFLLRKERIFYSIIDSRLMRGVFLPGAKQVDLPTPRLYGPQRESGLLSPEEIDGLYSELVILKGGA